MSTTDWLGRQIERLEEEIRSSSVFDSDRPASTEQLRSLREKVILRTYLKQQLYRRERLYDTKEYELVPLPVEPLRH